MQKVWSNAENFVFLHSVRENGVKRFLRRVITDTLFENTFC